MQVQFIEKNSLETLEKALESVSADTKSIMILSTIEDRFDSEGFSAILKNCALPIIGGLFPQIIFKNAYFSAGSIIVSLDDSLDVAIVDNLSTKSAQELDDVISDAYGLLAKDVKSMYVFVDGLSKNINEVILTLFENFGLTINYIGGGAGSLSFEQQPCIFSNKGILEDAAILATTKRESAIGVKHGWFTVSDPLKVTMAEANRVIELNYRPAFEVYKEVVEFIKDEKITDDNFFDIARAYPLGINKLSGTMVVRDPIMTKENALICVGDVAENSFVSVLHGNHDSLINAAKEAKQDAVLTKKHFTLFIDCVSRALFLQDDFQEEIDAIFDDNVYFIGVTSLGEIANSQKHYLEFYNKTAVVANIERLDE